MEAKFPVLNPIRFQDSSKVIDYVNYMPQVDLMRLGEDYQRGIYSNENYIVDYKVNTELSFVIQSSVLFDCKVVLPNNSNVNIVGVEITPAAWVGDKYYKYSYTPTTEGVYQFVLNYSAYSVSVTYTSDYFYASDPSELKDLVEINYYDKRNRNNGYWFDETTQVWNPKAFYTGNATSGTPENESSIFEDDGGGEVETRNVSKRIRTLTITDVDSTYLDIINNQLKVSDLYVNGIKCVAKDISDEKKGNSQLIDVTAKLTQAESDNGFLLT